jgi:Zn-dependent protease
VLSTRWILKVLVVLGAAFPSNRWAPFETRELPAGIDVRVAIGQAPVRDDGRIFPPNPPIPLLPRRAAHGSARTPMSPEMLHTASTWVLPVIIAITLHEAAHGYAAHMLGDSTAWRLGRVSLNPLKHVDPFGTLLLPGLLLFLRAPFLFGYAKPVPVNFAALNHPRRDMVLVAVAGPATNIVLATLAALLFHVVAYVPAQGALWLAQNLRNALIINVVLAVFNMLPLPPLDGGRVAVGLLPNFLALPLARLEPYGVMILLTLMLLGPVLGAQLGVDLNIVSRLISGPTEAILSAILRLTGNR